uniref:Uncharacterized protein n=1 Tax=Anguilla anguilla TaxID=7936 RepID=A0A0E9VJV9_ANGAN
MDWRAYWTHCWHLIYLDSSPPHCYRTAQNVC